MEDGPAGLIITWDHTLLESAAHEKQAKDKDPNKSTPLCNSMDELKATDLADYLDAPALVLRLLKQAELVGEQADTRDGRPVRLLDFKLKPQLSEKDRKFIKQIEMTAKLRLGANGVPVAAETRAHVKGRALLVIPLNQPRPRNTASPALAGGLWCRGTRCWWKAPEPVKPA